MKEKKAMIKWVVKNAMITPVSTIFGYFTLPQTWPMHGSFLEQSMARVRYFQSYHYELCPTTS